MSDPYNGQAELVLVVDDDPVMRMITVESLRRNGYRVVEGANGLEAVQRFGEQQPALVLLDVEMPILDGFSACQRIRALPQGEDVPIVIMTGLNDTDSVDKAYQLGATDFVTKPLNWAILSHRIRYILRSAGTLRSLARSESRLANAQRMAHLGHWDWNLHSLELMWSDELFSLFGVERTSFEVTYDAFLNMVHPDDREPLRSAISRTLLGEPVANFEHRVVLPSGRFLHVVEHIEVGNDASGKPTFLSGTVQDITERKQAEAQIRHLAYHDQLTALPNRELFKERVAHCISLARRHDRRLALLFVDIDRFKTVNDTLGHKVGDRLLEQVSDRLRDFLRATDLIAPVSEIKDDNLARLGGDEFTAILPNIAEREHATQVASRIIEILSRPYQLDGRDLVVTASVGIAFYPDDGRDMDTLVRNADAAMYAVKEQGRNGFRCYSPEMTKRSEKRLGLENDLRKALQNGEFELYYQPQIDLATYHVVGVEALIRWRHPERGLVSPADFIPIAEDTGLIVPIGRWVLEEGCRQNRAWQEQGVEPIRMSVNIAGQQFLHADFLSDVRHALAASGLDPKCLELEVTENALIDKGQDVLLKLHQIRALGISLAVDDFGTGYSSLSYIKEFPINTLKVDRSFVTDIGHRQDEAIVKTIIHLAHELSMQVISEGVETEKQLAFLRKHGSNMVQGYLFSRPLPPDEMLDYLRAQARNAVVAASG